MRYEKEINSLEKPDKKEYRKILKNMYDSKKKRIRKEVEKKIDTQINEKDIPEINYLSAIISRFMTVNNPSKYLFIRTEPLISLKPKNFDLLLFKQIPKTVLLLEFKMNLTERKIQKLKDFKEKKGVIIQNKELFDKFTKTKIKALDLLLSYMHCSKEDLKIEFALSTSLCSEKEIEKEAKNLSLNFCLWDIKLEGEKSFVVYTKIGDLKEGGGHKDKDLENYLMSWRKGLEYQEALLSFLFSSSTYQKIKVTCMVFLREGEFDFREWLRNFDIDLKGFINYEKRMLFENIIRGGLDYRLLRDITTNEKDIFKKRFKIICVYKRNAEKLEREILNKIVEKETRDELNKILDNLKEDAYLNFKKSKNQKIGQKNIKEFT